MTFVFLLAKLRIDVWMIIQCFHRLTHFLLVASLMPDLSCNTRVTVEGETPASLATSLIVDAICIPPFFL